MIEDEHGEEDDEELMDEGDSSHMDEGSTLGEYGEDGCSEGKDLYSI